MYVENITAVKGEKEVIFPSGSEFFIQEVKEHEKLVTTYGLEKELTVIQITIPLYII